MKKKVSKALKAFVFFMGLSILTTGQSLAKDVIRLSMMPRFFPDKITQMITPLGEYLISKTNNRVMTVLTRDNDDYERSIKNGEIDIGYQNPLIYVNVSSQHEVLAMALDEAGDKYRGLLIVRNDSDIKTIFDLIGRKVMIVGRTSGGGYFSPKLTLDSAGIDMDSDMELVEATDNKQENVIISVSIGDVDAGFIRESALHVADRYIRPNSVRVVHECAWLPNWAVSVKRSMPQPLKNTIKTALIGLKSEDPVLKAMNLRGFKAANDSDYDTFRTVLKLGQKKVEQ